MSQRRSDRSSPPALAASPPERRGLRTIHALIALTGMVVGLPLALVGGMSLIGTLTDNAWIRLGVPLAALIVIPLLIADRLLPADPEQRRRGLVRDVLSFSWAAAALSFVGLAGSLTAAPLTAEAARLDEEGWTRAAWVGRWMAGPPQGEAAGADEAIAQTSTPVSTEAPVEELAEGSEDPPASTDSAPTPDADSDADADSDSNSDADADADAPGPSSDREGELAARGDATGEAAPLPNYSPAELFSRYAPAVVAIEIEHGGFRSGGTGFFIDERGTLATNHHVIDGARKVRIKLLDGTVLERVELLDSDAEVDLALLRVDPSTLGDKAPMPTQLGDSEAVQVGEPVSVIGNPLGLDHTLTDGIVSARRVYEGERYIQMSAPISPGNSGGPVFDRHGRVIGVSVAHMLGGQNLNLAVPVSQLQAMVADEYPNRRSFGASSW